MTELLFRADAYARECPARVLAVNDRGGVVLDRTVFYPTGGGQPGDRGALRLADGAELPVATTVKGDGPDEVVHVLAEDAPRPPVGAEVVAAIDWERRHRLMRMHTCLHVLSAVCPYPVTGGQVGADKSRLDFAAGDAALAKEEVDGRLNALLEGDHEVGWRWITDAELEAQPDLVKTMSVAPPRGAGRVRLVEIAGLDLQPCGGTHVRRTAEIGPVRVVKVKSKGKQNKRVEVALA